MSFICRAHLSCAIPVAHMNAYCLVSSLRPPLPQDPTADRSVESLFAELVSNGIVRPGPKVHVQDYLGLPHVLSPAAGAGEDAPPPPGAGPSAAKGNPSMAQVRQLVTEYCLLPLGSQPVNELAPFNKGVLFYGPKGAGKTLLSRAVANLAGATWFDLSPRNTDRKYAGKQVSLMIHMVFKVARLMAPSVIYIDEAEKVFLSDKKKLKEFGSQVRERARQPTRGISEVTCPCINNRHPLSHTHTLA